ncbi:hypothetical protein [Bosea sp. (in: a-proteobacteria)]|uniref:hypothetical protein n=1 Tax=Bosea sp. (in: a-proteobacteria) TaxID=1871050 RepID=UPI00262B8570|nr:hypothetical protein [Bosea sp. (in: a-proteobacteria)]MCO5092662.1 hypothetical protein [Bosea sp. (in: a-proteobacteria)]
MASARGARVAAQWGTNLLQDNQANVLGQLGQGYDASQGYLGQAGDLYSGMTAQGQQGLDKYNALTLGSGADIQRALEGSGGYEWNLGQGLQALGRQASAKGMLNSGNFDTDTLAFAQGLAGQQLGAERAALQPYLGMYQQGIGGQAGVLGSQAGLATDYFGNRASVMDNTTKSIVGLGTEALKAGDQAKSQNQANMINGITGGVKLLGSLATGGLGSGFLNFGGAGGGGAI